MSEEGSGRELTFISHRFNLCAGLGCDSLRGNSILSKIMNFPSCLNNICFIRNLPTAMFMKNLNLALF